MKKMTLRTAALSACIFVLAAVAAPGAVAAERATAGNIGKLKVYRTAEWEGEWLSIASQADAIEKRGIFRKAAAVSKSYSADEIRDHFRLESREGIMRVKIEKGAFTFMTADGTAVKGSAVYSYQGFKEEMMEGREIQWHRFRLVEGYDGYPELICSEPHGFLGQWILLRSGKGGRAVKTQSAASYLRSMMFSADISPDMIADIVDTPEFIAALVSMLPARK